MMATPLQRPRTLLTVGQTLDEKKASAKKKTKSKDFTDQPESPQSKLTSDKRLSSSTLESPSYVSDVGSLASTVRVSQFDEGEERIYVDSESWQSPQVQHLIHSLLHWMNDVLAPDRIVLTDLVEDLYDGLIIRKLLERSSARLDFGYSPMPLVSLNKQERLKRLAQTLGKCAELLTPAFLWDSARWTPEAVLGKNALVIVQLSVALAVYFRAPIPVQQFASSTSSSKASSCQIRAVLIKREGGKLLMRRVTEDLVPNLAGLEPGAAAALPSPYPNGQEDRDAFDTLFDHAPEKLNTISKSLLAFVNKYLNKLNIFVTDLGEQFRDGVYLILLVGSLESYFIPFYQYHLTPQDFAQQLKNVTYAFKLMEESGLSMQKCRPEDIVNGNSKCILRILFVLYNRYQRV